LKQLIDQLIVLGANKPLIEQVFIKFVHGLTRPGSCVETSLDIIKETTASFKRHDQELLSEEATEASLTLIWKLVNQMISNGNLSVARQWCLFLLEGPVFHISPSNKAKLFR
ncbi:uncharacterized protein BO80DRAFT_364538, partial [Aspergillus ibericus CBS 121593]